MPTYQPNVPTGTVDLDQDYLNLQGNFQQLDIAYGYDHVAFSDTSGLPPTVNGISGLHKVIHALANTVTSGGDPVNYPIVPPTPVALTGEIFTTESNDGFGVDEILWYQTAAGKLSQLTSNIVPKVSSGTEFGYTFLAGGLIMQWGVATSSFGSSGTTTGSVLFTTSSRNKNFPNACFNVQMTLLGASGSSQTLQLDSNTSPNPRPTGFTWRFTTAPSGTSYTGFYWIALGY
jgi:hypothetical protein